MPIYEFECCDCHKTFDKLCSIKEDLTRITCAHCNGNNIRKKVSAFSTSGNRTSHELGGSGSSCSSCSSGSCSSCNH